MFCTRLKTCSKCANKNSLNYVRTACSKVFKKFGHALQILNHYKC